MIHTEMPTDVAIPEKLQSVLSPFSELIIFSHHFLPHRAMIYVCYDASALSNCNDICHDAPHCATLVHHEIPQKWRTHGGHPNTLREITV